MFCDRRSHDCGVPFQHGRVVGAQALEQARRALDVSEQKGDSTGWQVLRHGRHDATPAPDRSTLPPSDYASGVSGYSRREVADRAGVDLAFVTRLVELD